MKLYIENYNPKNLLDKMGKLKEYIAETKNVTFIYSEEGIFEISENNIFQLEPFSEKIQRITLDNKIYFLVDYTTMKRELTYYIPSEHNAIETVINSYSLTKGKNTMKMVVYLSKEKEKYVPYDFFIEIDNNENLTNNFVKENLNVFLSLLN